MNNKPENLFEDFEIVPVDESKLADSSIIEKIAQDKQDGPAMSLDDFKVWLAAL